MTSRPKWRYVKWAVIEIALSATALTAPGYRQNDKAQYIKMSAALFMTSQRMSTSKRISFMAALNRVVTAKFIVQSQPGAKCY